MKTNKGIMYFGFGTILQIGIVCTIITTLKHYQIEYGSIVKLIFLALGGLSSAIWGCIIAKKIGRVKSYKHILIDFFSIKQPYKYYVITFGFLLIVYGKQILFGEFQNNANWYTFCLFFIISILNGGVEEIGWRYTFQPMLEKKMSFINASIITFASWGIWHYIFFFSFGFPKDLPYFKFLVGLLSLSFVLASIYYVSNSLWLCVMYHALTNALFGAINPPSFIQTIITTIIVIILSIFLVRIKERKNLLNKLETI